MGQNNFGRVPIVLNGSNSFWLEPNHFGQAQIIKISPGKCYLNMTEMILTQPKQFGRNFGPIEAQGTSEYI